MNYIKQKIEQSFYTYTPGEFFPVYMDGELANRNQFYKYKAKKICGKVYHHLFANQN